MGVATKAGGKEYPVKREPQREPMHPGELLAGVLQSAGVSIMAAAEAMDVTRQTVHRLIAKRTGVSPDMAVRLGAFAGNGPGLWLRLQTAYDVWHAERSRPKARIVPIAEVRKRAAREDVRKGGAPRLTAKRSPRRAAVKARAWRRIAAARTPLGARRRRSLHLRW